MSYTLCKGIWGVSWCKVNYVVMTLFGLNDRGCLVHNIELIRSINLCVYNYLYIQVIGGNPWA